jgi:hypothetical protein
MAQRALRTEILRRASANKNAVKGHLARTHTIFCMFKKRPFHGRFRNCAIGAHVAVARRAAHTVQLARKARRAALRARETTSRTRFVKAEAVFFVVL